MTAIRSVVYRRGALEHFMLDGASLTLCGRSPEHINPGSATLPADDIVPGNYCATCVRRGRQHTATVPA